GARRGAEEGARGGPRRMVVEDALREERAVGPAAVPGHGVADEGRVLGVDPEVLLDGRGFGKAGDEAAAEMMLRRLSGRTHEVWSGIALVAPGGDERTGSALTRVRFRRLEEPEIAWYLDSGEWRDRAGAYAIQGHGAALVES